MQEKLKKINLLLEQFKKYGNEEFHVLTVSEMKYFVINAKIETEIVERVSKFDLDFDENVYTNFKIFHLDSQELRSNVGYLDYIDKCKANHKRFMVLKDFDICIALSSYEDTLVHSFEQIEQVFKGLKGYYEFRLEMEKDYYNLDNKTLSDKIKLLINRKTSKYSQFHYIRNELKYVDFNCSYNVMCNKIHLETSTNSIMVPFENSMAYYKADVIKFIEREQFKLKAEEETNLKF